MVTEKDVFGGDYNRVEHLGFWDDSQIRIQIDDIVFGQESAAGEVEGTYQDTCLPQPHDVEAWQDFGVIEQEPVGYKVITQSTIPEGAWHLRFSVYVMRPTDNEAIHAIINDRPHTIICALLPKSTLPMYLKTKRVKYPKTGLPEHTFMWTFEFVEVYSGPS